MPKESPENRQSDLSIWGDLSLNFTQFNKLLAAALIIKAGTLVINAIALVIKAVAFVIKASDRFNKKEVKIEIMLRIIIRRYKKDDSHCSYRPSPCM